MEGIRRNCFFSLFFVAAFLAGCGSPLKTQRAQAPGFDQGTGSDPANPGTDDAPSEVAGFFIRLTSDSATTTLHRADVQYDTAFVRNDAGTGNFTTDCRISASATGTDKDLLCIAEVEELDLFFSEMQLQYHLPPSMCSYVSFIPYHFYAFEPGEGPTITSYEELADGTIVDVTNTVNGVADCIYDYRSIDGPNCCTGKYTSIVTIYGDDGVPTTNATTNVNWGGSASACLSGPAMTGEWANFRSTDGFPFSRIEYIESVGFNSTFNILPAIDSTVGTRRVQSSVWASNFYNPTDHVGGTGSVPATSDIRRPLGLRIPPSVNADDQYFPSDTYAVTCLNRAREIRARIRLMIREWNTNPIAQGGDPDFDDGSGDPDFPDGPLNDYADWLDFGTVYSASST